MEIEQFIKRLVEGDLVHYVLPDGKNAGEHRPAIVVKVWRMPDGSVQDNGLCQLQVFVDGTNDYDNYSGSVWATSIEYGDNEQLGTWHFIEG